MAQISPRRASRSGLYLRDPNFEAKKWPREAQEGLQDQVSISEIPTSKLRRGPDKPKKGFKIRSLSSRSQLRSQEVAKIGPRRASRSGLYLRDPNFQAKKWPREAQEGLQDQVSIRDPNFKAKKWPRQAQEGLQDQVAFFEIPTSKPRSGQERPKKGFKIRSLPQRSQLPSQERPKKGFKIRSLPQRSQLSR